VKHKASLLLTVFVISAAWLGGCQKPLALETTFNQIAVGQSSVSEVLNKLPEDGIMHTASSVAVIETNDERQGLGLALFNQKDSMVERTNYIQTKHKSWLYFGKDSLLYKAQSIVSAELLDKPYERELDKSAAILRYFHDGLIADAKPFVQDQRTESLSSMARTLLGIGILELSENPSQAATLVDGRGFTYQHPNFGDCVLHLTPLHGAIYEMTITASETVDPFTGF